MSDTYTGTLDPSPSYTPQLGQLFPDYDDRQGSLVEIDDPGGITVDNIFYFNGTTSGRLFRRVIDGPIRAAYCGVFPNAGDQTTALQNALNHPDITTIVFDYSWTTGTEVIIDGTVTVPAGKVLEFKMNNRLGGTGNLVGGIIDAPDEAWIFNLANGFDPSPVATTKRYWSVKWWGAKGLGGATDDHAAIQYACTYLCRNWATLNSNELYFPKPSQKYRITKPIILSYKQDNIYNAFTIKMFGREGTSAFGREGATAWILADFNDTFAIGIQRGSNVHISGFFIEGKFDPVENESDFKTFYQTKFKDFGDGVSRDVRYSPYAGIVIDPFTQNGTRPVADPNDPPLPPGVNTWYPGLEAEYDYATAGATYSGSHSIHLEDLRIHRFVVGVCVSPSGIGRGCDGFKFDQITIAYAKVGFATCHDQTKENVIRQTTCWYYTHTVFDNVSYGRGQTRGTAFYVDGANIAGSVIRIFNIWNGGYFDFHATKIFAESIITIGSAEGSICSTISDSCFDFLIASDEPDPDHPYLHTPTYDNHGYFRNVQLKGCTFRRYGTFSRLHFYAHESTFDTCYFEAPPYIIERGDAVNSLEFINCNAFSSRINPANTKTDLLQGVIRNAYLRGNRTMELNAGINKAMVRLGYRATGYESYNRAKSAGDITLAVNTTTWKATFNTDIPNSIFAGDLVVLNLGSQFLAYDTYDRFVPGNKPLPQAVIGTVESVDTGTGDVTLKWVPMNVPSGNHSVLIARPVGTGNPFIGDVTNGQNVITNVELLFNANWPLVGTQVIFPCNESFVYGPAYARITAVDTGAKTITVDRNAFYEGIGLAFVNYLPDMEYLVTEYLTTNAASSVFADTSPYPIGAKINYKYNPAFDAAPKLQFLANFEVIKSGWITPNGTTKIHAAAIRREGEGYSHAVSANYTMKGYEDIVEIDASGGNVTVTLMDNKPDHYNKQFTFVRKDNSVNTVTIAAGAGDNISGAGSITLPAQYDVARILFKADGNHFQI